MLCRAPESQDRSVGSGMPVSRAVEARARRGRCAAIVALARS